MNTRKAHRITRHRRIRAKVDGSAAIPRLAVYRSNKSMYVQLIDDAKKITLFGVKSEGKSIPAATELGKLVAAEAKKQKITTIVFDRGGYLYHGRVKAFADAAREGGLKF